MPSNGNKSGLIRAGGAVVELSVDDAGLRSGLEKARKAALGFSKKLAIGGGVTAGVGAAIMAPILASFHSAVEHITEIRKAAEQLAIPTEMMSELGYAASKVGVDLDGVVTASRHVEKAISEAGKGSGAMSDLFRQMGLDAKDLAGKSLEDQFTAIADGLKSLPNEADRTAAAMELLGRAGVDMLPVLRKGSAGLKDLFQQGREAGAIISSEDAAKAKEYTKAIGQAREAVKYFWEAVGSSLLEAVGPVKRASDVFVSIVRSARRIVEENRGVVLSIVAVGAAVFAVGTAAVTAGAMMAAAATVATAAQTLYNMALAATHSLLSPFYGIAIAATAIGAAAAIAGFQLASMADKGRMTGIGEIWRELKDIAGALMPIWQFIGKTFADTWGGIRDALSGGDLALALRIAVAGANVVWQTFLFSLESLWSSYTKDFAEGWYGIIRDLESAWIDFMAMIKKGWAVAVGEYALQTGNDDGVKAAAQSIAEIDREAMLDKKKLQQDFDRERAAREKALQDDQLAGLKRLGDAQRKLEEELAAAAAAKWGKFAVNMAMLALGITHGSGGPAGAAAGMAAMAQGSFSAINAKQAFGSRRSPLEAIASDTKRAADGIDQQVKQGGAKFG